MTCAFATLGLNIFLEDADWGLNISEMFYSIRLYVLVHSLQTHVCFHLVCHSCLYSKCTNTGSLCVHGEESLCTVCVSDWWCGRNRGVQVSVAKVNEINEPGNDKHRGWDTALMVSTVSMAVMQPQAITVLYFCSQSRHGLIWLKNCNYDYSFPSFTYCTNIGASLFENCYSLVEKIFPKFKAKWWWMSLSRWLSTKMNHYNFSVTEILIVACSPNNILHHRHHIKVTHAISFGHPLSISSEISWQLFSHLGSCHIEF